MVKVNLNTDNNYTNDRLDLDGVEGLDLYLKLEKELLLEVKNNKDDKNLKEILSYGTSKLYVLIDENNRWVFRYNLLKNRVEGIIHINKDFDLLVKYIAVDGGISIVKSSYVGLGLNNPLII